MTDIYEAIRREITELDKTNRKLCSEIKRIVVNIQWGLYPK